MITMRNWTATLLLGLLLACGSVAAQQAPGLIATNPIPLTNVEGRMDHLGVDLKGHVLGEGFIDVRRQMDPDHYDRIGRVATPADSRTGLFTPVLAMAIDFSATCGRRAITHPRTSAELRPSFLQIAVAVGAQGHCPRNYATTVKSHTLCHFVESRDGLEFFCCRGLRLE